MKKVYDIKIADLKELLEILKVAAHEPIVQRDIWCLANYIKRYENNFSEQQVSLFERLLDDADQVHFYKPFLPFSNVFSSIGKSQTELSFDTSYTPFNLSDCQVMDDANDFFKSQSSSWHSLFLDFSSEASDHLKFIDSKSETSGETLFLKSTGEAFVFVPNYSNITKFTILVHETEHVLDFFANPDFLDDHIVSETTSVFMELIASDFIAKKYNLYNDNFQRRNYIHTLIKSQATILRDKNLLLDIVNKKRNLAEEDLFKYLEKNNFPIEDVKFFLEATINQDSSYQLPYLIAIELYYIYYSNKNFALKILEDIILNANQYNILDILYKYGILLNSHVLEYENSLYKKITL